MSSPAFQLPPLTPPTPSDAAYVAFKLAYQITPILLTNGIATNLGGSLPIVALTQGLNTLQSALTNPSSFTNLDGFFATYTVLPGGTLENYQVAMYPFANQAVAANAVIAQPLNVSVVMLCPAGGPSGGYPLKLMTMQALQNSLTQHNNTGGTYSIITPSFIYTNCLMTGMRDVSAGESKQVQYAWQMDFVQPLVTVQAANTAQNGLMSKLTSGAPISGTPSWSIAGLAVGNPTSLVSSSLVPPSGAAALTPPSALQ